MLAYNLHHILQRKTWDTQGRMWNFQFWKGNDECSRVQRTRTEIRAKESCLVVGYQSFSDVLIWGGFTQEIWNLNHILLYMMVILLPTFIYPLSGQSHKADVTVETSILHHWTQKLSLEDTLQLWLSIILLCLNNAGNMTMNDTQKWLQLNNAEIFFKENLSSATLKSYYKDTLKHGA